MKIETGLEVFLKKDFKHYQKKRIGLLCNQASIDRNLMHASQLILKKTLKLDVTCFIGPQHGIRGEKQDNMVESDDFKDKLTGLPVFSLYGVTRKPTPPIINSLDLFLIDLQDIGCRIYTFMYTMLYCMQAAKTAGKKVVILDRPNPIDGVHVEGNRLDLKFSSFVGLFPMSTRHGMTMGELALMFNEEFKIGCDLDVIRCKGWKRNMYPELWGRDWVAPSPNIPNKEAALVFPGIVHFEGTLISEGRGTTKPFEHVGAPYIDPDLIATRMNKMKLPGVYFRPIYFQPTYQKHKDQVCGGVQLHVTNRKTFNSFEAGIYLLSTIAEHYPNDFKWKQPPYEYENDKMPIDCITGSDELRKAIDSKTPIKNFIKQSRVDTEQFKKVRTQYLIY